LTAMPINKMQRQPTLMCRYMLQASAHINVQVHASGVSPH
jgi:hypothetical protein